MSFTFDQCKDFERWGYPQEGARSYFNVSFSYNDDANPIETKLPRKDSRYCYAIPTLEGVMEWVKSTRCTDDEHPKQECFGFGAWTCSIVSRAYGLDGVIDFGDGATAHEALYNLAKKVKGE